MPHLVQMDKKYGKKGLTVVAPEVQGSSKEAIAKMAKDRKLPYTITKSISGPNLSNGIPHMAVFDVKGQLIFSGHPMDDKAEKIIKTALKDATVGGSEEKSTSGLGAKKANLVEERSWTNTDGKSIKATLISLQDNTGKFTFPDGRSFDYDITKLSDADQTLIKEAVEAAAKTEDAEEE